MATNIKSASAIQEEWDLVTPSYIDTFNTVSHAGTVASRVPVFAKRKQRTTNLRTNPESLKNLDKTDRSDKSAVEAIIQSELPTFDKIHAAIDEASGRFITEPPLQSSSKTASTISYRTGVTANFQSGSRFNWFMDGTNLTYTDGPTVNSYDGSRAIWQNGDSFYQNLTVKKFINKIATDTYVSSITAGHAINIDTKSKNAVIRTYREAMAIHNVNISVQSSSVDIVPVKLDVSVSGVAAALQLSGAKTEIKAGGYACDMKIWPRMDEFRIGLLGYTLWDIGSLSVKNSITVMAMNNYMGLFCSFANIKVDVTGKDLKSNDIEIVSATSSVMTKMNQVCKVTTAIEKKMMSAAIDDFTTKVAELSTSDVSQAEILKAAIRLEKTTASTIISNIRLHQPNFFLVQ